MRLVMFLLVVIALAADTNGRAATSNQHRYLSPQHLDYDGNFSYNPAVDIGQAFGFTGYIPVVGD